ncbi:MAG: hypothetical protein VKI63_09410 [Cyanobium sp.]|jgi:hypothetical protein|nr:hypothetical protein [Cyanobium sp.]
MRSLIFSGLAALCSLSLLPPAQAQFYGLGSSSGFGFGRTRPTFSQPFGREYRTAPNMNYGGARYTPSRGWQMDNRRTLRTYF